MPTAKYRFTRGPFYLNENRPSTSALNATNTWADARAGRNVHVLEDGDEHFIAELQWRDDDHSAGPELGRQLDEYGIERAFITEK